MSSVATDIKPHPGPQEAFLSSHADIVVYGGGAGGGKTWALLMEPLRHVGVPDFRAVIFRRTYPEITNAGGLWDESWNLYPLLGAAARSTDLQWEFPGGARVEFGHLQHEQDKRKWQGSQIALIQFDELTHFTESQFFYMLSRNRSTCGVRPYVRATCNPEADSWVKSLVSWWLDDAGEYADPAKSGVVRWFIRVDGEIVWGDSPAELEGRHPGQRPKSFTFIAASLDDNPTLCEADPGYRANLEAMPYVERERLLGGNWKVHATDGAEWGKNPEYFDEHIWVDDAGWPDAFELSAIAIDPSKGATERSDYSAIVFVGYTAGLFWFDADIQRRPAERIADDGIDAYLRHRPGVVAVESNTFQYLFGSIFDNACRRRGVPPLPIELVEHKEPKPVRIRRTGPFLRNRQVRVRRNAGGQLLVSQWRSFGLKKVNDDGPDAGIEGVEAIYRQASRSVELPDDEIAYA